MSLFMARCYPWRDVIITVHSEMLLFLSMVRCYLWRDVIFGEMLSMARCYPWRDVIHGEMLSMARCYPRRDVIITIHGEMLAMATQKTHNVTTTLHPSCGKHNIDIPRKPYGCNFCIIIVWPCLDVAWSKYIFWQNLCQFDSGMLVNVCAA